MDFTSHEEHYLQIPRTLSSHVFAVTSAKELVQTDEVSDSFYSAISDVNKVIYNLYFCFYLQFNNIANLSSNVLSESLIALMPRYFASCLFLQFSSILSVEKYSENNDAQAVYLPTSKILFSDSFLRNDDLYEWRNFDLLKDPVTENSEIKSSHVQNEDSNPFLSNKVHVSTLSSLSILLSPQFFSGLDGLFEIFCPTVCVFIMSNLVLYRL